MDDQPRYLRGSSFPRSVSPPKFAARPVQYKSWSQDGMTKALDAVSRKEMSIREAAERFNVPKSTLGDRASGRIQHGATSGPNKYLTSSEEKELTSFIIRCASIGFPKTRHEVISLVQNIVDSKGIDTLVSSGWWQAFCKRNPTVTLRAPAPLSKARAYATDPELISRYYDLLEETLVQHDLEHKPCQIYNMDETGLPLNPKSMKCIYKKGEKNPLAPCSGDKSQITVVSCVSASGSCMPPVVIIKRKTLPSYYKVGEVPGTNYGLSPRGWIDRVLFRDWFRKHFLRFLPSERPILLLMDGHSSHFCPDTIRLAAEQDVIVFVLPPNATHLLQPLDKGTFGPLKIYWREECHKYMTRNPGEHVTKFVFSQVFSRAWERCMTLSNVRAGFKVTGVYPFDRNAAEKIAGTSSNKGGMYLPMLRPALQGGHCKKHHAAIDSEPKSYGQQSADTEEARICGHRRRYHSHSDSESKGRRDRRRHYSHESKGRRDRRRHYSHSESESKGHRDHKRHYSHSDSEAKLREHRPRHHSYYESDAKSHGHRSRHHNHGHRPRHQPYSDSEPESHGRHHSYSDSDPDSECYRHCSRYHSSSGSEPENHGDHSRHFDSEPKHCGHGRRDHKYRGHRTRHHSYSNSESEYDEHRRRHQLNSDSDPDSEHHERHRTDLTDSDVDDKPRSLLYCSETKQFLKTPVPPPKITDKVKSSGRVLTSLENMKLMEAKEKEKAEKERLKLERQEKKEAKKSARAKKKVKPSAKQTPAIETFTPDEIKLFTQRFDNGYDLKHDERYNMWLKEKLKGSSGGMCFSTKFT